MPTGTLIDAEQLAQALDDPRLKLFDCRFDLAAPASGREAYGRGHLPGAIYADLNRDLAAPVTAASGRHPLPEPESFARRLRDWGVQSNSRVVVYDADTGMYAARLWWMLRWLGHDDVAVLDGGLRRSLAASLGGFGPERAVAMCGSGVTACHLLLAMEHAGLHGARLYPGSWSEWSSDPARPVRRGPEP